MDFSFTPATRARIAAETAVFSRLPPAAPAGAGQDLSPAKKPAAVAIALIEVWKETRTLPTVATVPVAEANSAPPATPT